MDLCFIQGGMGRNVKATNMETITSNGGV